MRHSIILVAVLALSGCQASDDYPAANKTVVEEPVGTGKLKDREFAVPMLGFAKPSAGNEAVLRLDPVAKVIYFGSHNGGGTKEATTPYVAPELRNTAGLLDTPEYFIQFARMDCKSDQKDLGTGTITATFTRKGHPESTYFFCMVSNWPKDAKRPGWSKTAF